MIRGHLSLSDINSQHQDQHRLLFQNCLGIVEKVFTTAPTADNIPVGYAAIYESGATRRLYFNVNGTITYIAFGTVSDDSGDMLYADSRFYVGSFTRDTTLATGTQEVDGPTFTPKAVIFFMGETLTSEISWGFDDGTTDKCVAGNIDGTAGIYNPTIGSSIYDYHTAGSNNYGGSISSFDDNGFTISWEKNNSPTGTITIIYIAFR